MESMQYSYTHTIIHIRAARKSEHSKTIYNGICVTFKEIECKVIEEETRKTRPKEFADVSLLRAQQACMCDTCAKKIAIKLRHTKLGASNIYR